MGDVSIAVDRADKEFLAKRKFNQLLFLRGLECFVKNRTGSLVAGVYKGYSQRPQDFLSDRNIGILRRYMMIDRYWGRFFGSAADSAVLLDYLDLKDEVVTATEIFAELGLDQLSGDFTTACLDATVMGRKYHFDSAFQVVLDLAVLILESKQVGCFNLASVGGARSRMMRIDIAAKENTQITQALKYFSLMPEAHAIAETLDDDELFELGDLCEELRLQLD